MLANLNGTYFIYFPLATLSRVNKLEYASTRLRYQKERVERELGDAERVPLLVSIQIWNVSGVVDRWSFAQP